MILIIFCFIIVLLLFILVNKNSERFFNSTPKIKIIKDIKIDKSVKIDDKNNFNNNKSVKYFDNNNSQTGKSNLYLKKNVNIPKNTNIKFGNSQTLTAKKIRELKKNKLCTLELSNSNVMGHDYKASKPGIWKNAKIKDPSIIPKVNVVTRTGGKDTEQMESIGGEIADDIKRKECIASSHKNRFNKYYNNSTLKGLEYPGCDDFCCSPIDKLPEQIIYDKLCIGDTCINGEDLKILKGEKMLSLRSKITDKCMSYPDVQQGSPISWPTFAEILTTNDCIEYVEHIESKCMPDSNIGDYKNGSISDAKNECNKNPECEGFEYNYTSINTIDDAVWKRAFKETPTGRYRLKNNISTISKNSSSNKEKSSCFINPRSKLNNKPNNNNIYYQMVLSDPLDVKVTIPKKTNKILEEEVRDVEIARGLEESQQTALQNQINNYNLQERQTLESEYPPPPAILNEYILGIPVSEWEAIQ